MSKALKWIAKRMLVVVVALYAVLVLLALFSDRLIFQPQPATYDDQDLSDSVSRLREPGRLMHIISGGERITAIYLPNSQSKYTLLFSHGNAEDLGDSLAFLQMYREAGFSVFSYDYRGYGTSTGKPTENGVYADANAAYAYLTDQLHVVPDRIISVGRSVGCAPAIHLAANHKIAGLIAEAPFMTA